MLFALVLVAYLPLWRAGFIWDDDTMLTGNRLVHARDGLRQFWCTRNAQDYWPVTSTSLWLEWRLWGLHPLGYHLTNLAPAPGETCCCSGRSCGKLRIPGAWLAAMLFAVHPINVESVTWIAQRKNLMALLFALTTVFCFLNSGVLERAARQRTATLWYGLSLVAFTLAMLSKARWRHFPWSSPESSHGTGARLFRTSCALFPSSSWPASWRRSTSGFSGTEPTRYSGRKTPLNARLGPAG